MTTRSIVFADPDSVTLTDAFWRPRLAGPAVAMTGAREKTGSGAAQPVQDRGSVGGALGEVAARALDEAQAAEAGGSFDRALCLYAVAADIAARGGVAALRGDSALVARLARAWRAVVGARMGVTGEIGAPGNAGVDAEGHAGAAEAADIAASALAAPAFAAWTAAMFRVLGDAKTLDVLERTLYNALAGTVPPPGDRVVSKAAPDDASGAALGVASQACGDLRALLAADEAAPFASVGALIDSPGWAQHVAGLAYAVAAGEFYVVLYVAGTATIHAAGVAVRLTQTTAYPWDGAIELRVMPERPTRFALNLRIPGWARGQLPPGSRYRYLDRRSPRPAVWLNGTRAPAAPVTGFVRLERIWEPGDVVAMELPMPVRRLVGSTAASAAPGRVALQRGPLVYCVVGAGAHDLTLPDASALQVETHPGVFGDVAVLRGAALRDGEPVSFAAIPWCARSACAGDGAAVWLGREVGDR